MVSKFFRFDLKLVLLLVVDFSILSWVAADAINNRPRNGWPQDDMEHVTKTSPDEAKMICSSVLAIAFTLVWLTRKFNRPILLGAIGGILGFLVFCSVYSLIWGVGYFFYEGTQEYIEDGAIMLILAPILYAVVYSPLWAGLGALAGGVFWAGQVVMRRVRAAKAAEC